MYVVYVINRLSIHGNNKTKPTKKAASLGAVLNAESCIDVAI